jgi:glycosyltransferase involved in cell wall biosynthesis
VRVGLLGAAAGGAGGVLSSVGEGLSTLGHTVSSLRPQEFSLWQRPMRNPGLTMSAGIDNFLLRNPSWKSHISYRRDFAAGPVGDFFTKLDLAIVRWPNGVILDESWPAHLPIIWGLPDQNAFTGVCHYSGSCRNYETGCQACPALRAGLSTLSSSNLKRKLHLYRKFKTLGFVAPSEWMASRARESMISPFQVCIIPNPLQSDYFTVPSSRGKDWLSKVRLKVGFAATNVLDPVKGFDSVSGVLSQLERNGRIEVRTAGLISSVGKKQYPNFSHLGKLSVREMTAFYDQIDVVVVPSIEEAAGMVPLEAMARGVVPIVRATGGLKESVSNDVGYKFGTAEDLTAILMTLTEASLLEKRIRGRALVNDRSPTSAAKKYLEFGALLTRS